MPSARMLLLLLCRVALSLQRSHVGRKLASENLIPNWSGAREDLLTYLVGVQVEVLECTCGQHLTELCYTHMADAIVAEVCNHTAGVEGKGLNNICCALVTQVFG